MWIHVCKEVHIPWKFTVLKTAVTMICLGNSRWMMEMKKNLHLGICRPIVWLRLNILKRNHVQRTPSWWILPHLEQKGTSLSVRWSFGRWKWRRGKWLRHIQADRVILICIWDGAIAQPNTSSRNEALQLVVLSTKYWKQPLSATDKKLCVKISGENKCSSDLTLMHTLWLNF